MSREPSAYPPQTAVPQIATDCTRIMREQGKAYPRTCPRCGLGPCAYQPTITIAADKAPEPVAWVDEFGNTFPLAAKQYSTVGKNWKPLYAAPPLRELSEDEIRNIFKDVDWTEMGHLTFARAIIAAARESP